MQKQTPGALKAHIDRLAREIETMKAAIMENSTGRYIRALQAREHEHAMAVARLKLIELAKPLARLCGDDDIDASVALLADRVRIIKAAERARGAT